MNITGELRNWNSQEIGASTSLPKGKVYWGNLYNDTKGRWADGVYIHTSKVMNEEETPEGIVVTTLNSIYFLPHDKKAQ